MSGNGTRTVQATVGRRDRAPVRAGGRREAARAVPCGAHVARLGAERLWKLLHTRPYVAALGALTGAQAVQMVKAGPEAIYLSGWQVAADANLSGHTYPDQSLYPVERARARQAPEQRAPARRPDRRGRGEERHVLARADRRRRRGRLRRAAERVRAHEVVHRGRRRRRPLRGPALVGEEVRPSRREGARPDGQFIRTLVSARLAADVLDVPTILVARTDALSATLLTSDVDERDREFLTGERTPEGFFRVSRGSRRRSRARSRTRRTPISSGARPRRRTSTRPRSSRRPCTRSTRTSSSRTTARRRSTGRSTSTTRRSRASSRSSRRWATSSSS